MASRSSWFRIGLAVLLVPLLALAAAAAAAWWWLDRPLPLATPSVELSIEPEKLPSSANEILFKVQALEDPSIESDADSRFIGPSVR